MKIRDARQFSQSTARITGLWRLLHRRGSRHRLGRSVMALLVSALALPAFLLAVPAGISGATQKSHQSAKAIKPVPLNVGVGSVNLSYGPFWVAMAKGFFKKDGVTVNIVSYNTAANTANMIASGEVDVQLFSPALGFLLMKQGIGVQYVYNMSSFTSSTNAIISSKSITSVSQLQAMGTNCRFASTATASIPYVSAISYSRLEGLKCQLVQLPTVPAEVSAVVSGSSQLASVPYTSALVAANAGQVNFLVDPLHMQKTVAKKLVSAPYPVFVVLGQTSLLKQHRVAVTRFVKALRQAAAAMAKLSDAKLGVLTATLPAFAGQTAPLLTEGWRAVHPQLSLGPNAGFINRAQWANEVRGLAQWDLPGYTLSNPLMKYASDINMTFWNNAS